MEKLGEGGMGVVYKALDVTLGRIVALKFISASAAADESMKQRLMHEAKACAALNHPNITTIYEFVQTEEHQFIAIEFIEGKTLDFVLEAKPFALEEVLSLALQLLDGLEAAHRKGIIHRDLKASNIMLDSDDRVKIMDFGLAKLAQGSMLTQAGSTVGTAAYMSPEQAKGETTDHRTDIYSLGVVLYQLLTGTLPFPHAHHLAILYAVVNEDPKPPKQLNPAIPDQLEKIVLKAMAKIPAERFQSCGEMAQGILQASESIGGESSMRKRFSHLLSGVPESPATGRAKDPSRLSRSVVLGYGIPGIILILVLVYGILTMLPSVGDNPEGAGGADIPQGRIRAKSHVDTASSLMKMNDAARAFEELQRAIEADSTYGFAWANLAALNVRAGHLGLAMKQGKRAITLLDKVNGSSVCYNIAYTLEEMGNNEEAIAWYSEAIMTDSSFTAAYCALANLHVKSKRPDEALRLLVRFERLYPQAPDRWLLYRSYGKAHLALRNYSRAVEVLEESNRLNPADPEVLFLLATTFEVLKMNEESLTRWQQYAEAERDPTKRAEAFQHVELLKKQTH